MIDQEDFDRLTAKASINTLHPRPVPPRSSAFRLEEHYIVIDSRDRDRTAWPSTSKFQVKIQPEDTFRGATLSKSYRNVKQLQVVSVSYPNKNNVLDEMYLFLTFPEIDGVFDATNSTGSKAIARLTPTTLIGDYVHVRFTEDERHPKKRFQGKGARIDKLTPEFRKANGELFDFGQDNPAHQACNPKVQTSICLRIITQVPNIT